MKILFLTLVNINSIQDRNLYSDLMRKFRDEGHDVYIVTPSERRYKESTSLNQQDGITLLRLKTLNIQKTNLLEKGISTLLIEHLYLAGIKKYFPEVRFDLVLYSTPPITFTKVIRYIKQRDGAKSYLLLKDIFPQNAVDLSMISKGGLIHRYFRYQEKKLYQISDFIGCMSPANVGYVVRHNPGIDPQIVEVNPNSIEPDGVAITKETNVALRQRYHIPPQATAFVYGGNLGKPQGIDFLLEVLNHNKEREDCFFVIVGSGTEFTKVQSWFTANSPANAILLAGLPKEEYDQLIQSCDVGMIFLDRRFTIPNFPSRLLAYLEHQMPVIAATDIHTDLGKIIEANEFGFWGESGDLVTITNSISRLADNDELIAAMGQKGYDYLLNNYTSKHSYQIIMRHFTQALP